MKNKSKIIIGSFVGLFVLVGIILIANFSSIPNFVRADYSEEFSVNDKVIYSKDDLKVSIVKDSGEGEVLGSAELKSHSSVTEIKSYGFGKEEVVMYYDFTGWEFTKDGLGKVYFIDKKTGREIERDYHFVIWGEIDVPNYVQTCVPKTETKLSKCTTIQEGTKKSIGWARYDSNDIPGGSSRIGLKTYVGRDDYIDAVWTIVGKKVEKHISWSGDLNTDLVAYYPFDETSGTTVDDLTGTYDATAESDVIFTTEVVGTLNTGADFGTQNAINLPSEIITKPFSVSMWTNHSTTSNNAMAGGDSNNVQLTINGANKLYLEKVGAVAMLVGDSVIAQDVWTHVVMTYAADGTTVFYVNGSADGNDVNDQTFSATGQAIGEALNGNRFTGSLDEFAIWSRVISPDEVTYLYSDNPFACGYGDEGCGFTPYADFNISGIMKFSNGTAVNKGDVFAVWEHNNSVAKNTTTNSTGGWNLEAMPNSTYIIVGYDPTNESIDGDVEAHVKLNV